MGKRVLPTMPALSEVSKDEQKEEGVEPNDL